MYIICCEEEEYGGAMMCLALQLMDQFGVSLASKTGISPKQVVKLSIFNGYIWAVKFRVSKYGIFYHPRSRDGLYGLVFVRVFSSVSTITHEPLHAAWWHFAGTCTLTTSRTVLNFKVIGERLRSRGLFLFFCVRDAAASHGEYLALSKAG